MSGISEPMKINPILIIPVDRVPKSRSNVKNHFLTIETVITRKKASNLISLKVDRLDQGH